MRQELSDLCIFLENDKTDLHQFFPGFRKKDLFITTCIKKHYTGPLIIGLACCIHYSLHKRLTIATCLQIVIYKKNKELQNLKTIVKLRKIIAFQ